VLWGRLCGHAQPLNGAASTEQMLEITYSYWDGSGHRRTIKVEFHCWCYELVCT